MRAKTFLFSLLILFFSAFFLKPAVAFASSDFSASFVSNYVIDTNGRTNVVQKISLKNLTKNLFAKEYNLTLGTTKIDNIQASDSLGAIDPEIKKDTDSTLIHLVFNDKVVGSGKSLNFELDYSVDDIANKNGLIWEVNIPKISIEEDISSYKVTLKVPPEFGQLHYVTQKPISSDNGVYQFEGGEAAKNGISLALGDFQIFNFALKYHLQNNSFFPTSAKVALPPDRDYQQMVFDRFDPTPTSIDVDPDGNYIANFSLKGKQKLAVTVAGQAKIVEPHRELQKIPLEKIQPNQYLSSERYWEANDPAIVKLAKELKTPEAIYGFVSTNLKYDYNRLNEDKIERLGALGALKNKNSAICMEFTDLFIALARSAGIPARELNGYAYTQNKKLRPTSLGLTSQNDVLHAWPEYWDKVSSRWIPVDPTWAATSGVDYFHKLDTNHFVFSIKGASPLGPLPAGTYKIPGEKNNGDVQIQFANQDFQVTPDIEISASDLDSVPAGFSKTGLIKVKNISNVAIFNGSLSLNSNDLKVLTNNPQTFEVILPGQTGNLEVKLDSDLKTSTNTDLLARVNYQSLGKDFSKESSFKVLIKPIFLPSAKIFLILIFGTLAFLATVFAVFLQLKSFNKSK